MGSSCTKSESVTLQHANYTEDAASSNNNNTNNNEVKEDVKEMVKQELETSDHKHQSKSCKDGECARYVKEALEKQVFSKEEVGDVLECLCDMPGHELTFNFDNVPEQTYQADDVVDLGTKKKTYGLAYVQSDQLFATGEDGLSDSMEELNMMERKTKWNRSRPNNFDYSAPSDTFTSAHVEYLDVCGTKKSLIYAMSDLHLGGNWSNGMEGKLETYFNNLLEKANEEVACLVLLGDVFEMWLDKFHQVPEENSKRVELWKTAGEVLVSTVRKLVDEFKVKVFYVRGNHDHEIGESETNLIFDGRVTFIPCTLILRIKYAEGMETRARFSHGHEWDVFNSYVLCKTGHLLPDRPIGYYVARAVATAGGKDSGDEIEELLIGLANSLLSAVPKALEDDLVDVLTDVDFQRRLLERLFEGAFKVKDIEILMKAKCRVDANSYITLQTMLNYPLFKLSGALVGKRDVFHMIKAATGNYKKFVKRCDEDVIVLAHTHIWDLKRYRNYRGNPIVYANTGCWTNNCSEFSTVVLDPPSAEDDGVVQIDHGKNK